MKYDFNVSVVTLHREDLKYQQINIKLSAMTILKKTVLLLKSQKNKGDRDKYELVLKQNGFRVKLVKTLDFTFKNLVELKEKLKNPDRYNGVIFSSPRSVQACVEALDGDALPEDWKCKYNFVVGETTCKEASDNLGLCCSGKDTGNADNLVRLIITGKDDYSLDKPFLYPHGNLKTDTLQSGLEIAGLSIEDILVYDTIPNPSLEAEMKVATDNFTTIPEYVIFFSPSGVRSTIPILRSMCVNLNCVKFIASGPITEKAIIEENLPVYASARNPTQKDVLRAVNS